MTASDLRPLHYIEAELAQDRARYRRWTNRVIRSSANLLDALEDWQLTPDEPARTEARRWAQRCARELKKARNVLAGIKATLRVTEQQARIARAKEMT